MSGDRQSPLEPTPAAPPEPLVQPVIEQTRQDHSHSFGRRLAGVALSASAALTGSVVASADLSPAAAVTTEASAFHGYMLGEPMTKKQVDHLATSFDWEGLRGHEVDVEGFVKTEQGTTVVATVDNTELPLPLKKIKEHIKIAENIINMQSNYTTTMDFGKGMEDVNIDLYQNPVRLKFALYTADNLATFISNDKYVDSTAVTVNSTKATLTGSLIKDQGKRRLSYAGNMGATENADLTEAVNRSVDAYESQDQMEKFGAEGRSDLETSSNVRKYIQEVTANRIANAKGFADAATAYHTYVKKDSQIYYYNNKQYIKHRLHDQPVTKPIFNYLKRLS